MKYLCPHCNGDLTDIVMILPLAPKVHDQLVCHMCLGFTMFDKDLLLQKSTPRRIYFALQDPRTMQMLFQMYCSKMSRKAQYN